jgi:signal transduction histidine kinase
VRFFAGSERFRPSSIALALGLAVALGLLFIIDRSISQNARTQARLEVIESATLVEGFLALHAQGLQSLRAVGPQADQEFEELVEALTVYAPGFRSVWLADSSGNVRQQHVLRDGETMMAIEADIDTIQLLGLPEVAARARSSRRMQVSSPGLTLDGDTGFLMVEPLYRGGAVVGFAGGAVASSALLRSMEGRHAYRSGQLFVLRGNDTLASRRAPINKAEPVTVSRAPIRTPGGTMPGNQWEMVVVRPSDVVRLRILLWGVGIATILSVALVMRDEHRQARQLTERTTELERLSTELLRANRAKSEFLASVSHELRTPLNAIVGFVDLLRDGVYGTLSPQQVGPVERIASSASHLRQLVDQVLDIAKMAAGRLEVHPEPIDLRGFVLDVVSEVEMLISERSLNLSLSIPTTLPKVYSDSMLLRQILLNLLSNATEYTSSGGIALRARLARDADDRARAPRVQDVSMNGNRGDGGWVMLQVADSGIGIVPADRERIFEEFEQVNAGSRGDSMRRGTGLGLAISRRLARLLGGDITVESELGKGSTFTVWLPVATVPAPSAPREEAPLSGTVLPG